MKGGRYRRTAGQPLVETDGKVGGHRIVDGLGRSNDGRNAGVEQSLHLGLGGAAVQKDQLQAALAAQERRQPACIGHGRLARRRLQQQLIAFGMAAIVKEGDAVAVAPILKDIEQRLYGDVLMHHDFAVTGLGGAVEYGTDLARFLGQVAQIADLAAAVVGKG